MSEPSRRQPVRGVVTATPARARQAETIILGGGGEPSSRQITAELTPEGLRVVVSARLTYGSQGRRTAVSLAAKATPEQEAQLQGLLEEIAAAEESRLQSRLRYDVMLAHQAAIEAGEEAGPEVN